MDTPKFPTRRDCLVAFSATAAAALTSRAIASRGARRNWPAVQATLDEFVRERSAPGVAMGLCVRGLEPAYPHAGTIAFDSTRPFDADSICRLYSMTKNVT